MGETVARKIIAFLGKYPKETQYSFQGKIYTGQVFAEAMGQLKTFPFQNAWWLKTMELIFIP